MGLGGGVAGGGRGTKRSRRWLLVLCGDGRFENAFTTRKGFMVGTVATTKRFWELFCANSECAPIANIRYWHAPITNIRYWHGQRADKGHSLLAVPIANHRNNRSNSECRRNNECLW